MGFNGISSVFSNGNSIVFYGISIAFYGMSMDFVWDHILNQQTLVFLLAFIGIFMGFAGNLKPLNDHRILMITIGLLEFDKVCPRCAPGIYPPVPPAIKRGCYERLTSDGERPQLARKMSWFRWSGLWRWISNRYNLLAEKTLIPLIPIDGLISIYHNNQLFFSHPHMWRKICHDMSCHVASLHLRGEW